MIPKTATETLQAAQDCSKPPKTATIQATPNRSKTASPPTPKQPSQTSVLILQTREKIAMYRYQHTVSSIALAHMEANVDNGLVLRALLLAVIFAGMFTACFDKVTYFRTIFLGFLGIVSDRIGFFCSQTSFFTGLCDGLLAPLQVHIHHIDAATKTFESGVFLAIFTCLVSFFYVGFRMMDKDVSFMGFSIRHRH